MDKLSRKKIVLFGADISFVGAPWSLLTLTRLLDLKRFDIRIITKVEFPNYEEEIIKQCENALCLGISCITGFPIKTALNVSKIIKKKYPKLPIIWGGWQAVTLPDITLRSPFVDYLCNGPGETMFYYFIKMLDEQDFESRAKIIGLSYKENGKIFHNKKKEIENLNWLPDFNLNLINWEKYLEVVNYGSKAIRISTSYGCPNHCGFCCEVYSSNRHWIGLSAERVVNFLIKLKKIVNFDSLVIGDNNFFVDEERVIKICRGLLINKFNIKLIAVNGTTNVLVNYKESTWKLLKKSGLTSILIGTESGNNNTLKTIDKPSTVEQTYQLNQICKKYQIKLNISTIIGIPSDDYFNNNKKNVFENEFNELATLYKNLFDQNEGNSFNIFTYSPLPSTPLYDRAIKLGFKPPTNLLGWSDFDMFSPHFSWMESKILNKVYTLNMVAALKSKIKTIDTFPLLLKTIIKPIVGFFDLCFYLRYKNNNYTYFIDIFLMQKGMSLFFKLNNRLKLINIIDVSL